MQDKAIMIVKIFPEKKFMILRFHLIFLQMTL